jgi:CheY-like chemotaxis protein
MNRRRGPRRRSSKKEQVGLGDVNPVERFSGARILVIEDEEHVRAFIVRVLELEGAIVVAAASGAEGLARFRDEGPFHLVTLDVGLPDVSGWEVLDAIRAHHPTQDQCRVVVLSASVDPESPGLAAARNAAFVTKPSGARALVEAIALLLPEGFRPQA